MNRFLAMAALGLVAMAPSVASASTPDAAPPAEIGGASRFEIVDLTTGRPIAILVPIAGAPRSLRIVGIVRAVAPAAPVERQVIPEPLTAGQMIEQWQKEVDEMFHVQHDGG